MGNNVIYVTYDKNLKRFLDNNGCENILYGLHPKTKRLFWVYERTDILALLLDKWFK